MFLFIYLFFFNIVLTWKIVRAYIVVGGLWLAVVGGSAFWRK